PVSSNLGSTDFVVTPAGGDEYVESIGYSAPLSASTGIDLAPTYSTGSVNDAADGESVIIIDADAPETGTGPRIDPPIQLILPPSYYDDADFDKVSYSEEQVNPVDSSTV